MEGCCCCCCCCVLRLSGEVEGVLCRLDLPPAAAAAATATAAAAAPLLAME